MQVKTRLGRKYKHWDLVGWIGFAPLKQHPYTYNSLEIPGYEIDFENVEILDCADTTRKFEYKEILFIRKLKPTINKQTEGELFTLIMRNVKLESSMERDIQKNY